MASLNNNRTIEVPEDMVEEVRRYMDLLALSNRTMSQIIKEEMDEKIPKDSKEIVAEVSDIINHHRDGNKWKFNLTWDDGTSDWVDDDDCNCEWLINNYLSKLGINTVYLLCRVSTKVQAGTDHVSLEAQEEILKGIDGIKRSSRVKIVKMKTSAYKRIPDKMIAIGEAAKYGDALVSLSYDRFGRNIVEYLTWLEDLNKRGVVIYIESTKTRYDINKVDFLQGILTAQKESDLLSTRIKRSIEYRKKRGDECIGSVPYGKTFAREPSGRLVVVDDEKALGVIKMIMSSRSPCECIADELNSRGLLKKGRKWTTEMVRKYKL